MFTSDIRRRFAAHLAVVKWGRRLVIASLGGSIVWWIIAATIGWDTRNAVAGTAVLIPVAFLTLVTSRLIAGYSDALADCDAERHQAVSDLAKARSSARRRSDC